MAKRSAALTVARVLGSSASAACIALWVIFLYANPYTDQSLDVATRLVAWVMIGVALFGVAASLRASATGLAVVSVVSFVPEGFYFVLTPGVFRSIGALNLVMLLAAFGLSRARRRDHDRGARP